jgi:hypothetical protein
MSEDSLLPNPVLSISSYSESSASTEILGKKSNEDERIFESLPHWVLDMSGSTEAQCIGGSEIRFDDFKKMAEPVDKYVNFNLIWNVSKSRLQLKGQLAGKDVSSDLTAPDIDLVDIWKQLLNSKPKSERHAQKEKINGWVPQRLRDQEEESSLFDDWDPGSRYLKVKFTAANDIERKTMCTDLTFESPDIYGLDRFDSLITTGIQIAPDSSRDAQDWAEWRLKESVSDYASYENFFAWWEQAKKPFVDYEIKTPERSKYAILEWYKNTEIPSHRAWYLIAAEDWRL